MLAAVPAVPPALPLPLRLSSSMLCVSGVPFVVYASCCVVAEFMLRSLATSTRALFGPSAVVSMSLMSLSTCES